MSWKGRLKGQRDNALNASVDQKLKLEVSISGLNLEWMFPEFSGFK